VNIRLTLALPRDEVSVPVVRRLLKQSLDVLGVEPSVIADIQLALTEACTNVLDHAGDGDHYEVSAGIDSDRCVVQVADCGAGFDGQALGWLDAAPTAEGGRGIQLMRALVDELSFYSPPGAGMVVRLAKRLSYDRSSMIGMLTEGDPPAEPIQGQPLVDAAAAAPRR
jgi:serine/threonine-protein kinase RsbW